MRLRAFIEELENLAAQHGDDVTVYAYNGVEQEQPVVMPVFVFSCAPFRINIETDGVWVCGNDGWGV